ncbi:MAG: O-antigen ligase family protein [Elusimicrobiota bacterium]
MHLLIGILLLIEIIDIIFYYKDVKLPNKTYVIIFCALFFLGMCVLPFSMIKSASKSEFLNYLSYAAIFFFITVILKKEDTGRIIKTMIISTIMISLSFILFSFKLIPFDITINPNVLAGFMVIVFPFILDILMKCKNKFSAGFAMLIIVIVLILAKSVIGWVCVGFELILFLYFKFGAGRVSKYKWIVYGVLLTALTIIIYKLFNADTYNRLRWWITGIAIIKDHPLFGVGPGCYSRAVINYGGSGLGSQYAHSYFLELISEWGIIWALVYFYLIGRILKKIKIYKNHFPVFISAAIGIGINSIFEYNLLIPAVGMYFWIVLAVINADSESVERFIRRESEQRFVIGALMTIFLLLFIGNSVKLFLSNRASAAGLYLYQENQINKALDKFNYALELEQSASIARVQRGRIYYLKYIESVEKAWLYNSLIDLEEGSMRQKGNRLLLSEISLLRTELNKR